MAAVLRLSLRDRMSQTCLTFGNARKDQPTSKQIAD